MDGPQVSYIKMDGPQVSYIKMDGPQVSYIKMDGPQVSYINFGASTCDMKRNGSISLQINVVLQCIEEVSCGSLKSSATVNSVCSVHARHSECCLNTLQSQFSLPIPLSVTQSFQTTTGNHSGETVELPK